MLISRLFILVSECHFANLLLAGFDSFASLHLLAVELVQLRESGNDVISVIGIVDARVSGQVDLVEEDVASQGFEGSKLADKVGRQIQLP